MLRVEVAVVVYVPGDETNEEDVQRAYDIEHDVEASMYAKYLRSDVIVDYVGTVSVEQDDKTYPMNEDGEFKFGENGVERE